MKLKTLNKTTWNKIKINEVFVSEDENLWNIYLKISNKKVFYIANNQEDMEYFDIGKKFYRGWYYDDEGGSGKLYKLSKSIQRLWKEE